MESETGLGLSTAYGIAKNHEGGIAVESHENKGSRFFVYLPAVDAETAEPAEKINSETVSGKGAILLVDDDSAVIETSSELLELLGFIVFKASGGPDALQIFQDRWKQIDLVILDLVLPEMGGKELYHRFKKINPAVKVLCPADSASPARPKYCLPAHAAGSSRNLTISTSCQQP